MTWLASATVTKRPAFTKRPWITAACSQARFDGGPHDPRTLVHAYQQELRAELLDELTYEIEETDGLPRWLATFSACQDALRTCESGLRWLWLAEPRRIAATTGTVGTDLPIQTAADTVTRAPVATARLTATDSAVTAPGQAVTAGSTAARSAPAADARSYSLPLAA